MASPHRRARSTHRLPALVVALALVGGACSGGDTAGPSRTEPSVSGAVEEAPGTGRCDPTDPSACLLPWPSDQYTRSDPSTVTGRRLDLPADGMPSNADGVAVDPAEWNRNDGFGPTSILLVVVPDLDPAASGLPPVTDMAASLVDDSPLTLVDVDTGERLAAWAELDTELTDDPARRPLRVVPAAALPEGHRIAVGLHGLRTTAGEDVEPTTPLHEMLQHPDGDQQEWLTALAAEGAATDELDAAWSFTVASADSITGPLRAMWRETAAGLGDGAPPFTVDSAQVLGGARIVEGSFEMPKYLTGDGGPGTVLDNDGDPDGIPERDGTMTAPFTCVLPVDPLDPSPVVLYGHGLLGSRSEVRDIGSLGASVGIGFCALDFLGMSSSDIPTVLSSLQDLTRFRTQADRLQQGHLGFLLLGRLLASPQGFTSHAAFQRTDGLPSINGQALAYLGASQGGILGGPATALSPDWNRAIFAVGGMGYNLLLGRSIDFDDFAGPFQASYPDPLDRAVALELMEQLWQRGENAGWAQHITEDPFEEGGGPTTVLLLEAFGDHQVANVSTETLARTLGVPRVAPTLAEGRSTDVDPFFAIPPIAALPHTGSALVVWDFGTPAPPMANTPPREGDDPHGKLSGVPQALALVAAFVQPGGVVLDVCGGLPCASPG
jgi:hypothetical protein